MDAATATMLALLKGRLTDLFKCSQCGAAGGQMRALDCGCHLVCLDCYAKSAQCSFRAQPGRPDCVCIAPIRNAQLLPEQFCRCSFCGELVADGRQSTLGPEHRCRGVPCYGFGCNDKGAEHIEKCSRAAFAIVPFHLSLVGRINVFCCNGERDTSVERNPAEAERLMALAATPAPPAAPAAAAPAAQAAQLPTLPELSEDTELSPDADEHVAFNAALELMTPSPAPARRMPTPGKPIDPAHHAYRHQSAPAGDRKRKVQIRDDDSGDEDGDDQDKRRRKKAKRDLDRSFQPGREPSANAMLKGSHFNSRVN
jgi:hypothetical protein